MVYITTRQAPMYRQVTIEELLTADPNKSYLISTNVSNTRTVELERVPMRLARACDVPNLVSRLTAFNDATKELREAERKSLYRTFKIPKKSGGMRTINEPNPELMTYLRLLKSILENDFGALYNTSAFAYVKKRNALRSLQRHQANESRWYSKFDFHDFFGSTTLEFVMSMLGMIYPFSEFMMVPARKKVLETALELGFLDGGLPQGTPLSPTLTNIVMIPFDFRLTKKLRQKDPSFVYTRYADDLTITSKYDFKVEEIEELVLDVLKELNAPFTLNTEKTRYGSTAGSNWNLGLMVNKDNEITIGAKRKREFKCALHNYIRDKNEGNKIDRDDINTILGQYSYYRMVERAKIDAIVDTFNKKYNIDIISMMRKEVA